jgi:hypothetical protein
MLPQTLKIIFEVQMKRKWKNNKTIIASKWANNGNKFYKSCDEGTNVNTSVYW